MKNNTPYTFIDLFAGCGGLSLGLIKAGFKGIFAVEKNKDAFSTLQYNLSEKKITNGFSWQEWLPIQNLTTHDLLSKYRQHLHTLEGKVDLIAGGPPCQGFSFVGLRNPDDPRNRLTEEYIDIVSIIKPKIILLENVKGFQAPFKTATNNIFKSPYANYVVEQLESEKLNYKVFKKILPASDFAVPQSRPRFVMIALRKDILNQCKVSNLTEDQFFLEISIFCKWFKKENKLNAELTSVKEAINDLKIVGKPRIECVDCKGFEQLKYIPPKKLNSYLTYLRAGCISSDMPNSLRIPKHRPETKKKFEYILANAEKGRSIPARIREKFNIKKQCLRVLCPDTFSSTITTSPDDCLHYDEPRVLTVRENARLQSFPDWFEFQGRYTTGGIRRRDDCPRYTQVGNAVPPLMAEILGKYLYNLLAKRSIYCL